MGKRRGLRASFGSLAAVLAIAFNAFAGLPAGAAIGITDIDRVVDAAAVNTAAGHGCEWLAPVDAPIAEGFVAPGNPYGPGGNRGIDYATVAGQRVGAVANGRVSFAGPVGGRIWVVVSHEGGLRSSYGPLVAGLVVRGQSVSAGGELGQSDVHLHLTARAADRYLDPAPLLAGSCGRPRLVPTADG